MRLALGFYFARCFQYHLEQGAAITSPDLYCPFLQGRLFIIKVLSVAAKRSKARMAAGHEPECLLDFWSQTVRHRSLQCCVPAFLTPHSSRKPCSLCGILPQTGACAQMGLLLAHSMAWC